MKLEKIDSEIANKSLSLSRTQTLSKSVGLESEIRELQRKKSEISLKVDSLNKRVSVGKLIGNKSLQSDNSGLAVKGKIMRC